MTPRPFATYTPDAIETALLERARSGDQDAFRALVEPHLPQLNRTALRITRNRADAEEVVQETLCQAHQHLPVYRQEAAFSTWLVRIAVNRSISLLRSRRRTVVSLDERIACPEVPELPCGSSRTPEQIFLGEEREEVLRRCLGGLHPTYRTVLLMHAVDELSNEEIAARLSIPVNTVKVRMWRARHQLRQRLEGWLRPKRSVAAEALPQAA